MANRGGLELGALPQTILVVEDEAWVRLDATELLRDSGYCAQEAANANEALHSLQSKFTVDLLFTDINLGNGMNRIELVFWALANLPRVKVLVTTEDPPLALGTILAKPYQFSVLLERVQDTLAT
jgi:CheY-like chemotaxis protein